MATVIAVAFGQRRRAAGDHLGQQRRYRPDLGRHHWRPGTADPFTGHTGWINAVAFGQVDGRAVIVSGSDDADGADLGRRHRRPDTASR